MARTIKDMMKAKFRAENMGGGSKPSPESKKTNEKDDELEESSYENLATEISISSGPSAVVIRHFLWDSKIHSHYNGKTLYVYVAPNSWKTKSASLKSKKSVYVDNKWKKMKDRLGPAYLAMAVSSGICTSAELNAMKTGPSAGDIMSLLNKLF